LLVETANGATDSWMRGKYFIRLKSIHALELVEEKAQCRGEQHHTVSGMHGPVGPEFLSKVAREDSLAP